MRRVAVRGIAMHEGKLLCTFLKPYTEMAASGGDWWCLPGGTVDPHEGIEQALVREMVEETGIEAKIGKLLYVHQFLFKDQEQLEFFLHIENATDYQHVDLSNTSHGGKEIEKIEFVDPKTTFILPKFLTEVSIEEDINDQGPTKFFSFT